jgi:hypothetical protein
MCRKLFLFLCVIMLSAVMATAQDADRDNGSDAGELTGQDMNNDKEPDAKELSGISIVGNDDAPKSLYIVPWKSSEIGVGTSLDMMLNESDAPVDRDVFKRRLEFYQVSTAK